VVKFSIAFAEDTRVVELEVVGIDGNRDGLFGDGGSQLVGASLLDVSVSGDFEVSGLDFAFLVSGNIGVFVFSGDTVFHDEFEGIVHKSSIASLVIEACGAVNKLRFRE